MAGGARLDQGSPARSVDSSDGGAPLYAFSPERRALSGNHGGNAVGSARETKSNARIVPEAGDSANHFVAPGFRRLAEGDFKTPTDPVPHSPAPAMLHRSYSKSTLRAAAASFLKPSTAASSSAAVPPALNLASYPGPGAAPQRQPSLSVIGAPPPAAGTVSAPVAATVAAPQAAQGRASVRGSTTHSFINAMQAMNLNVAEENIHPAQKAHRDQTCKLQARIWGLRQGMYRQNSIPKDFLVSFDYDVQELLSNVVKMSQAADSMAADLEKAQKECQRARDLETTVRRLESDVKDWKERYQNAEATVASLATRSDEDMRTVQFLKERLRQNEMATMILQEQVDAKRNLWLKVHSDPQERAAAMESLIRASTPLSGQTFANPAEAGYAQSVRGPSSVRSGSSRVPSSRVGSIQSGSDLPGNLRQGGMPKPPTGHLYYGAPQLAGYAQQAQLAQPAQPIALSHTGPAFYQHQRRQSAATSTSTLPGTGLSGSRPLASGPPSSRPSSGARRPARIATATESGSPPERKRSSAPRALVRAEVAVAVADADGTSWADEFRSLFALVYGFCASYFHELPQVADGDWKAHITKEADGDLWDYMCRICQTPGPEQNRGDYALRLLRDRDTRPYLLQRLILQHIVVFMFSYEGWKDYSEDVDEEMEKIEEDLKGIDPSKTYDRQQLVNRRAQLVAEMAEGANAAAFRNFKVTQHHQHLKTMVVPFLARRRSPNIANEAFYDLFAVTTTAWELSAKLFRSRLTFRFSWADVGARFVAASHEPLEAGAGAGATGAATMRTGRPALQADQHGRVRLCATPAVTVRNDQGLTIDARNIIKAGVLVMRY